MPKKNGAINQNRYGWAFGSGPEWHITVIPCDGKIIKGYAKATVNSRVPSSFTVSFEINQAEQTNHLITKGKGKQGDVTFNTSLAMKEGDVIRFKSKTNYLSLETATVRVLIKLD